MTPTTLLIGATRGTGLEVANLLLARGERLRIIARDLVKARGLFADRAELVHGDLTSPDAAFRAAFDGVRDVIFTAAVPPGLAREATLRATDQAGVLAALEAARAAGLAGRFLYMCTCGLAHRSLMASVLDVVKWNVLGVRRDIAAAIHASPLAWTIVRAGMLTNHPPGTRPLRLQDGDRPLHLRVRVARADVATVLVAARRAPEVARREVSVVWSRADREPPVEEQLAHLAPAPSGSPSGGAPPS